MRITCDMFGPHDVTTLAEIVANVGEYDEEGWLYVSPDRPLRPDTHALVVDEGSERHWRIVRELGLVEHHEMFVVKEVVDCHRNRDDEASVPALVDALNMI